MVSKFVELYDYHTIHTDTLAHANTHTHTHTNVLTKNDKTVFVLSFSL